MKRRFFGSCAAMATIAMFMVIALGQMAHARDITINVVDQDGAPVTGFRWLVEEDNTLQTPPGVRLNKTIGTAIHKSHAPVVIAGEENTASAVVTLPDLYAASDLMISVLPYAGHAMSGKTLPLADGDVVEVVVQTYPLPTAQISVLVFNDNNPINNAPDALEVGLEGWTVKIDDTGGQVSVDVFGNPLGTTYQTDPETGEYVLVDGVPQVLTSGQGYVTTDANGQALVKYLAPGKYGVNVTPPPGQVGQWTLTSTIEGTPTVDAWVKANEPPVFLEGFGTGMNHVFFAAVDIDNLPWGSNNGGTPLNPASPSSSNLIGVVNYNHFQAPPTLQGYHVGIPVPECFVGLNDAVTNEALIAVKTTEVNGQQQFDISGIPPGTYTLVTWDLNLDALFGSQTIIVHPGTNVVGAADPVTGALPPAQSLLQILSFKWFGEMDGIVFDDTNENGFWDAGETGIQGTTLNIRYRDGSMYQSAPTNVDGTYEFQEVFPFFKFLVVEVGFAKDKATGATYVVDYGGAVPTSVPDWVADGKRNPLNYPYPAGPQYRTQTGQVLTLAMQLFLGQYNRIDFGKANYQPGENGGISGIVSYATTRAVNDPALAAMDFNEPGVPWVQVALYRSNQHKQIVDINGSTQIEYADVDNYPQGWIDDPTNPAAKGPEDVDHNGNGIFEAGDAVQIAFSDSWDDNEPTDCNWGGRPIPELGGGPIQSCIDNFGVWNQIENGVFDGGYAFADYYPAGWDAGGTLLPLPSAAYFIVEVGVPPNYQVQREEDKNVDLGDEFVPGPLADTPECVGDMHVVPPYLSLQTIGGNGIELLPGVTNPVDAPFAGDSRPLCDRKWVYLNDMQNQAADFNIFTYVPKAARAVGFVNNDLGAEFYDQSPIYGEKPGAPWIPVSFRDWNGNEVARVYADEWGSYNAMLPSNWTNNLPTPLGFGPQMITGFLNHPFLPNGSLDPWFDPSYAQMGWTFMYYPGKTSYLDTPTLPLRSNVGYPSFGEDLMPADGTPVIDYVTTPVGDAGPLLRAGTDGLVIYSQGLVQVPNPAYSEYPGNTEPQFITRDYGFGIVPGSVTLNGVALNIVLWSNDIIAVEPVGFNLDSYSTGQLVITKGDTGEQTEIAPTVHVVPLADPTPIAYVNSGQSIQAAIDAAVDGSIIFVRPGTYDEAVIVNKNLRLQGYGGDSTQIYAYADPLSKVQEWHAKVQELITAGEMKNLGNQTVFTPFELPGFMVLTTDARAAGTTLGTRRIDGFSITGSVAGGGINVPDLGINLQITNNHIYGNLGTRGGGVVVGQPEAAGVCPDVTVANNWIMANSGKDGGGGGVSIYVGSDDYRIVDNRIAGNFTTWNGGGICHYGLSDGGLIKDNLVLFNEVFFGGQVGGMGGGIYLAGEGGLAGAGGPGAGSVLVNANLIQGNLAGAQSGGGIRSENFNGDDTAGTPSGQWWRLGIINNIIVNNIAAFTGGGVSLHDTVKATVSQNTIANNDCTSTSANSFAPNASQSTPQGAGVVTEMLSATLQTNTGQTYVSPVLTNNIIANNRSWYFDKTLNNNNGELVFDSMRDLQVFGSGRKLDPQGCILTSSAGYPGNYSLGAVNYDQSYDNTLIFSVVIDEAGNNIASRFNPLTQFAGDYHIQAPSQAQDLGDNLDFVAYPELAYDFDGERRASDGPDIGADQIATPTTCNASDVNLDGSVNLLDLAVLRADYGCTGPQCVGDINNDGVVNATDVTMLLGVYGAICP